MLKTLACTAVAVVLVLTLTGCGADDPADGEPDDSAAGTPGAADSTPSGPAEAGAGGGQTETETATAGDGEGQPGQMVLTVESTRSRSLTSVTYFDPTSDSLEPVQDTEVELPFTRRWNDVDDVLPGWNMNAQQNAGGRLTCRVSVDGEVVAESSVEGEYAVVSCAL